MEYSKIKISRKCELKTQSKGKKRQRFGLFILRMYRLVGEMGQDDSFQVERGGNDLRICGGQNKK